MPIYNKLTQDSFLEVIEKFGENFKLEMFNHDYYILELNKKKK